MHLCPLGFRRGGPTDVHYDRVWRPAPCDLLRTSKCIDPTTGESGGDKWWGVARDPLEMVMNYDYDCDEGGMRKIYVDYYGS